MATVVKCKNCKHWEPTKDRKGICFRWAPRPTLFKVQDGAYHTVWAETEADRRCGEGEE